MQNMSRLIPPFPEAVVAPPGRFFLGGVPNDTQPDGPVPATCRPCQIKCARSAQRADNDSLAHASSRREQTIYITCAFGS